MEDKRKNTALELLKVIFVCFTAGVFGGAILSIIGYGYFGFGLGVIAGGVIAFLIMLGALASQALKNLSDTKRNAEENVHQQETDKNFPVTNEEPGD